MAEGRRVTFEGYLHRLLTAPIGRDRGDVIVAIGLDGLSDVCDGMVPMKHRMVRVTLEEKDG